MAGQVLVPLTSPNAHIRADAGSLRVVPPLYVWKNLTFLSHTGRSSLEFFLSDRTLWVELFACIYGFI